MKIEDRPLADPHLPKAAWIAFGAFGIAVLGASVWIAWLLWANVEHPIWPSMVLYGGYGLWLLWSVRRKAMKRRQEPETGPEKIPPSENSD